jgi:hypothetical protein
MNERLWLVVGTFIAYTALYFLNDFLFSSLQFSPGVNWIYLPSGFRLMFVLLFVESGAVGVALASIFLSSIFNFKGDLITVLVTGLISGFAPYLARYVCHDRLSMDLGLQNLTARKLIGVSVVFALISASMHQVFYTWRGQTENFFASTAVMFLGDIVGTITMLYIAKFVLLGLRQKRL